MFWLQTLKFPQPFCGSFSTRSGDIALRAASMFVTAIGSTIAGGARIENAEYT